MISAGSTDGDAGKRKNSNEKASGCIGKSSTTSCFFSPHTAHQLNLSPSSQTKTLFISSSRLCDLKSPSRTIVLPWALVKCGWKQTWGTVEFFFSEHLTLLARSPSGFCFQIPASSDARMSSAKWASVGHLGNNILVTLLQTRQPFPRYTECAATVRVIAPDVFSPLRWWMSRPAYKSFERTEYIHINVWMFWTPRY